VSRTKYCEILWCFANDEGRPLGTSVQAKVPNRLMLLSLKDLVVSDKGKGPEVKGSGTY